MFTSAEVRFEVLSTTPSQWDRMIEYGDARALRARERARRNYKPKPPAKKPTHCRCGKPLTQKRMGRPIKHCSRPCREASWREAARQAAAAVVTDASTCATLHIIVST